MKEQLVAEWMSTPAIVVAPTISLAEAQRVMDQRHIRRLPVVSEGRLVGIITRSDLRAAQPAEATLSFYEWRALLDKVTVAEGMTRDPVAIAPGAPAMEAARLMLARKISGLPVVEGGRVVGVITESDLFRLLIAVASGDDLTAAAQPTLVCHHCGARLRGRTVETVGRDDECWRCHYHLHRCENCRYFDGIGCILGRAERHTAVPGRDCAAFAYLSPQALTSGRP